MRRICFSHLALALLVAFFALAVPNSQAQPPAQPWFPLQSSNNWVLATTNSTTRTILCTQAEHGLWQVTGLLDVPVFLRSGPGANANVLASATERGTWSALFRFGRTTDWPWPINLMKNSCDHFIATWATTDTVQITPVGTFTNCRHWQSQLAPPNTNDCTEPATVDLWFAAGIGPVALQTSDGQQFQLTSATVGNIVYPTPTNGIVATLTANQSVYTNVSNHFVICPPCTTNNPPCELPCTLGGGITATADFVFQVTNGSGETQTVTFLTGQRFDIQLIDTNGIVMAAWSDNRAFPQLASMLPFPAGATWTYDASMALQDRNGNMLSGPYTARAFLTNTGNPTGVQAFTPIKVFLLLAP